MSRKRKISKLEMLDIATKLGTLADRMRESVDKVKDDGIELDGWASAIRGANLVRDQFVKVIGEANLRDVLFSEYKLIANKLGGMAAESKPSYEPPTGSKPRKKPES